MSISPMTAKRLKNDFKKFYKTNPEYLRVAPHENNPLEVYFMIEGLPDSPYAGGQYIGKIIHHPEYPRKAPDYMMLTPNGRYHLNKKICITISGYHQGDWAPGAWNLVTILTAFSSVWHSDVSTDLHGIGHLPEALQAVKILSKSSELHEQAVNHIKTLAEQSIEYNKTKLSDIYNHLMTDHSAAYLKK